jgi:hypothetical protein
MTTEAFRDWLEQYLRPQEKRNAEKIKELFAADGVYWYGPYYSPRRGVQAIYEHHRNALSHQENLKYRYEILATTSECGIAKFYLQLRDLIPGEPNRYEGIFLVYLNSQNQCTLFQEWYHSTTVNE